MSGRWDALRTTTTDQSRRRSIHHRHRDDKQQTSSSWKVPIKIENRRWREEIDGDGNRSRTESSDDKLRRLGDRRPSAHSVQNKFLSQGHGAKEEYLKHTGRGPQQRCAADQSGSCVRGEGFLAGGGYQCRQNCGRKRFNETMQRLQRDIQNYRRHGVKESGLIFDGTKQATAERFDVVCGLIEEMHRSILEFSSILFPNDGGDCDESLRTFNVPLEEIGEAVSLVFECIQILKKEGYGGWEDLESVIEEACEFSSRSMLAASSAPTPDDLVAMKMTNTQARTCASVLLEVLGPVAKELEYEQGTFLQSSSVGCSRMIPAAMTCLAELLGTFGRQLPAEETANDVVNMVLLPILEDGNGRGNLKGTLRRQCRVAALDGIGNLMKFRQHASSILAPLVVDVSSGGEERHRVNPLRTRTLRALQSFFIKEDDLSLLSSACRSLSSTLDAIHSMEKGNQIGNTMGTSTSEMDVRSVAQRMHSILRCPPVASSHREHAYKHEKDKLIRCLVLELLTSQIRARPNAMAAQWNLFLPEPPTSCPPGELGDSAFPTYGASPLLDIIHSDSSHLLTSDLERVAAMVATEEMFRAMPLHLWLGATSRQISRSTPLHGTRHLGSRVRSSILNLLLILHNKLKARIEGNNSSEVMVRMHSLCGVVITHIPFDTEDTLIEPAIDLLSDLGNAIVEGATMGKALVEPTVFESAVQAIVDSMGGRTTQQGTRTPLPRPCREWLSSTGSTKFLDQLLRGVLSDRVALRTPTILILTSLARMAPWVVMKGNERTDDFLKVIKHLITSGDDHVRLDGAKIVESFLLGRKDLASDILMQDFPSDHCIPSLICPLLLSISKDGDARVRASSQSAYGALQGADWEQLFQPATKDNSTWRQSAHHFHRVLALCVKPSTPLSGTGESVGTVRSMACKAIGNMCTECITTHGKTLKSCCDKYAVLPDPIAKLFCREVADVLVYSTRDSHAPVRSMALFALGNLALAVKERNSDEFMISPSSVTALCKIVFECIDDVNEKVVGNAIRTVGHLSYLIYHDPYESSTATSAENGVFFRNVVEKLSLKIKVSIHDATGSGSPKLSWKQRLNTKKHSWGSCHALALMLDSKEALNSTNCETSAMALRQMIDCIKWSESLNEKVTLSSIATLKALPAEMWTSSSCEGGAIGVGISTCLVALFQVKVARSVLPEKLVNEISTLLCRLIYLASDVDIRQSMREEDVSTATLDFLYGWMVAERVKSSVFEKVVVALHARDLGDKFSLLVVQKFSSRALHDRRNSLSPVRGRTHAAGGATTPPTGEYLDIAGDDEL